MNLRPLLLGLALGLPVVALAQDEAPAEAPEAASAADVEALRAEVERLRELVEEQAADLADQRLSRIDKDGLKFSVEGFYRTRAYSFGGLFADQQRPARLMDHRLRIRPVFDYRGLAKLKLEVQALDNVVWGDNASLASTSLFALDPSNAGPEGFEVPSIELKRAWLEFSVPVGQLRIGRQPSDWGMGLLANDGDGFDDDFGDNKGGATYDRALFATRPIAVAQAILGKEDSGIPLIVAVGVDRLVEDPLIAYYGYDCEAGLLHQVDDDYDRRCDADLDGVTDLDHGLTDDTVTADSRDQEWWAPQRDDVMETVYVLTYRGQDVEYLGDTGDLVAGAYVVHRRQRLTDSNVVILDGYLDASLYGFHLTSEVVNIRGTTRAIALPGATNLEPGADPLLKDANIWGYVVRAGYERTYWKAVFEHGYASGDDNVADQDFTGRPLHPDFNVGLLLYDEVLARVTSELWTKDARGLWSNGGVYNSRYVFPKLSWLPLDRWEILGGFLMAWPDKPDGAFIRCREGEGCVQAIATAAPIGWEVDAAIKHRWHEHLVFSLESGYAHATDRLPLEAAGLNPKGNFFTVQSRVGWEF